MASGQSAVDVESYGFRRIGSICGMAEVEMAKMAKMAKRIAPSLKSYEGSAHITVDQGLRTRPCNTRIYSA